MMTTQQPPWWDFSRIDDFGTIDPQGNFWKPDSNIQIPGNYPIVAILPGTVTSVEQTAFGGQTAITIKLDSPINSLATHTFYEHMSGSAVSVGQHVNQGDLIGYNNPSGSVPLGFGFYSGDVYGHGSDWQILQNDLAPGGANLLNPVPFLNAMKAGSATPTVGMQGVNTSGSGGTQNQATGPNLQGFAVKAGLFGAALILIVFGNYLLWHKQIQGLKEKGFKIGMDAAKVGLEG